MSAVIVNNESFGMYMTTKQFQELCSQLSFNGNHMTYSDFVANFEDRRAAGPAADLVKSPNHKWNAIRGDEVGITAEQVELKFMAKLRENFEDLWGAFYKFDDDHKGNITKKNFRRILDTFMFNISDSEHERLCQRMGIDKKTKINYKEFLERFEVRNMEEGDPWLVSDHRFNTVQPTQPMTADEVHEVLKEKAHRQWKDLAKAFRTMDSSGNGIITRRELRETLYRFILPIEKEEFRKLWAKYDVENKGYISHEDFLHRLTGGQSAPGDEIGTSTQITQGIYKAVDQHHRNQQAIQEKITLNQADKSTKLWMKYCRNSSMKIQ